jgi:hypothetical protein
MRIRSVVPLVLTLLLAGKTAATAQEVHPSQDRPSSQESRLEIPAGWTVFRDQGNLVVFHPTDWRIRELGEGGFFGHRPKAGGEPTAIVLVKPIPRIDGLAVGVVRAIGKMFPDLFPGVEVTRARTVNADPEVALGDMTYDLAGERFQGSVMCFRENQRGVIYVISSRVSTWPQDESTMKQMLVSFFYPGKEKSQGMLPEMTSWRDPVEGAFTCPVPQGWQVDGGLRRFSAIDARPEVLSTSPDNTMAIRIGDASVPWMVLPGPMLLNAGLAEGSWYSPDGVNKQLVMRYLPATVFLTEFYLPQTVGEISDVQTKEFPDVSRKTQALWNQAGIAVHIDTGEVRFDLETDAGELKGYGVAETVLVPLPGAPSEGHWYVTRLFGYLSSPTNAARAHGILEKMALGYRTDPTWQAQQARTTAQVSRIWRETANEIADIIHETFQNRSRTEDQSHKRRVRAIRDEVLIHDPRTGEQFEVPSGSSYYWRTEAGEEILGTDSPTPPDLPNDWVNQMEVGD